MRGDQQRDKGQLTDRALLPIAGENHCPKEMLIHSIRSDEAMAELGVSSKLNADWDFLCYLRDRGRAEADRWLSESYDDIGKQSSVDIREEFL